MNEQVNHPRHYNTHPAGIECIHIVCLMLFDTGNALKYIWRCDLKGPALTDLKKAIWYIEHEIGRMERMGKIQSWLFYFSRLIYLPELPYSEATITGGFNSVLGAGIMGLLDADFRALTVNDRLRGLRVALDLFTLYADVLENQLKTAGLNIDHN